MNDVEVITSPVAAASLLDPVRAAMLAALAAPASAAALAARIGLPRQKVNYHLRALEEQDLVVPVEQRRWGGLTERVMIATASSYVVSTAALGPVGADPARSRDRLSASYLVALAARAVREVGDLCRAARAQDKRLATLSIDTDIRFRSAADRADFTAELADAVAKLAMRYHDEDAPGGRAHRLIVGSYPVPGNSPPERKSDARED